MGKGLMRLAGAAWRCALAAWLCAAVLPFAAAAAVPPLPPAVARDLVTANHILVDQGVIDVRGHVSVRDPRDPTVFWIARDVAPGAAAVADLQAFDLDGRQVGGASGLAYTERFIHARVYKARPDIKSVVHAHTRSVVVLSQLDAPMRPISINDLFIGNDGVPVHSNGTAGDGVRDIAVADDLARLLGAGAAVMMRGHGVVVVGDSIVSAVGRAIGLDIGAQQQLAAMASGAKVSYLTAPPNAVANFGNYAREWSWWTKRLQRDGRPGGVRQGKSQ